MKMRNLLFLAVLAGVLLISFAGCSAVPEGNPDTNTSSQAADVSASGGPESALNVVTIPEQYSITYEVESAEGVVYTVQKIKDADGNIYFRSSEEELLFLANGNNYILYQPDGSGNFSADDQNVLYNSTYVETATGKFMEYAEKSQKQFIPGMESTGDQIVSGRECAVYTVETGVANFSVVYQLYVDQETGICLGWEEEKAISGHELEADGEVFRCTEFLTGNIPSLTALL